MTYDEWKLHDPADDSYQDPDRPEGCTCRGLGAGGIVKTDKWCPIHGRDPDEEYEKMRERRWDLDR